MKTAVLTGGSSELGKAISEKLAADGYEVLPLKVDVTSDSSCKSVAKNLASKKIFVLINVAGVNKFGESLGFSPQDFLDLLNVNVVGHFRLLKALNDEGVLPKRVINITSLNSFLAWPKFALYCASKFAADGLGLALRYELFPKVQVTNVAPGAIHRPNAKAYHQGIRDRFVILKYLLPFTTDKQIASKISDCLNKTVMPARIVVGVDAQAVYWMQKLLPNWLVDKLILWLR